MVGFRWGGGPISGRALLCTTDADGKTGVRSTRISSQYASAARIASRPMIGKKTKGGLVITSSPLRPEFVVSTTGDALGVGDGDSDGVGEGEGEGDAAGVGVGGPWRVKLAHGFGGTLAHRRCTPGLSPGKGVTALVKLPLPSLVTLAVTCESLSQ